MPERFLDVSHEALIRGWPRLRGWLDEDRAGLRLQRRISEAAGEWQRSNRDHDLLYRGARLIEAQEWRARHEVELNLLEREFLNASIALKQRLEQREREQQQRELQAAQKLAEAERRRAEEALAAGKKISEVASRGNVSLARYSRESGKNAQALAHLAQALRLNPENREASGSTAAMLTQLTWHVPLTGSMRSDAGVHSVQFSPDSQRVVTASKDKMAQLWDAASGKAIGEPMKHEEFVVAAQFSPDSQRVVTASKDKTARLWDAATGKAIGEPMKHEKTVRSAQFSPDGRRVVTASGVVPASVDKTARRWDAAGGKAIGEPMKHEKTVRSAQFSPDGQRVVTASVDNTARLWEAASGKAIGEPMKHENTVNSAQFSPDSQRVVTASKDNTARLWDGASGKPIGEPMKHEGLVYSAQFSPDGQRVVTASGDKTARLWDLPAATKKDTKEDILLLSALSETMGGVTLESAEQAENFTTLRSEPIGTIREKITAKLPGAPSELSPLQRFLNWSVADRRTRTISPFSQVTVPEWLENRIKEGRVEGLRAALEVDPVNARLTAHLGRRLADFAVQQGVDPDEARRARGEADFLTSRAEKLAPDGDEVKKLRDEVVKLLELKTN